MAEGPKLENLNLKPAPMGEPIPMIGNLPKVTPSEHWRPIETAPVEGSFLVWDGERVFSVERDSDGFWSAHYKWAESAKTMKLKDWMPLPEPPEDWRSEMIHLGI